VHAAAAEVWKVGCLNEAESDQLRQAIDNVEAVRNKRVVLDLLAKAAQCLRLSPSQFEDFGQDLGRGLLKLGAQFPGTELTTTDTFIRGFLRLHYGLRTATSAKKEDTLNDFSLLLADYESGFRVLDKAHKADVNPLGEVPSCMELGELLDYAAWVLIRFPDAASQFAPAIRSILCDAPGLYDGGDKTFLINSYNVLIRFDDNIAATSYMYLFERELGRKFCPGLEGSGSPVCLSINPTALSELPLFCTAHESVDDSLLEKLEVLKRGLLEESLGRLADKSSSWRPSYQYGVLLYQLGKPLTSGSEKSRGLGMRYLALSCNALREGMEQAGNAGTCDEVQEMREQLARQALEYAEELMADLKLELLLEFARGFLDPAGILTASQEAPIQVLAARASFALDYIGETDEHVSKSRGLTTNADLKAFLEELRSLGLLPALRRRSPIQ
jgi:hypothetical protein